MQANLLDAFVAIFSNCCDESVVTKVASQSMKTTTNKQTNKPFHEMGAQRFSSFSSFMVVFSELILNLMTGIARRKRAGRNKLRRIRKRNTLPPVRFVCFANTFFTPQSALVHCADLEISMMLSHYCYYCRSRADVQRCAKRTKTCVGFGVCCHVRRRRKLTCVGARTHFAQQCLNKWRAITRPSVTTPLALR